MHYLERHRKSRHVIMIVSRSSPSRLHRRPRDGRIAPRRRTKLPRGRVHLSYRPDRNRSESASGRSLDSIAAGTTVFRRVS